MMRCKTALFLIAATCCGPVSAQADDPTELTAQQAEKTTVIGRAQMPEVFPEGIDTQGLSLADAVVMLKGNYKHPRMPRPEGWSEMIPDERRAWHQAFLKSQAYRDYERKVAQARAARPIYTTELAEDGTFSFAGIKAGWYELTVSVMHPNAEGETSHLLARAHALHQFIIKDTDQPFNAGALEMRVKNVLMPGDTAPQWTAKAYDGREIKLSDFAGKYVLIDFWATWCGPCKAEIPNLKAVYKDFAGDRFEMVGLSLDTQIDLPKAFSKANPSAYLHGYLGSWGKTETTARAYGVTAIPSIWLIGPEGKVIARDLRGEALREAVRQAVGGTTGKN